MLPRVGMPVQYFAPAREGTIERIPQAAVITTVHSDTMVNINVANEGSAPTLETSVEYVGEGIAPDTPYCQPIPSEEA